MTTIDDKVMALVRNESKMMTINKMDDFRVRFKKIRHNYKVLEGMIQSGLYGWDGCPYIIASWTNIMTPIELGAWHEIRSHGLMMWPQFPIGKYFADFACPVSKIILECDGRRWHNKTKDMARDVDLESMGWIVFRAPGWICLASDENGTSQLQSLIYHIKNLQSHRKEY